MVLHLFAGDLLKLKLCIRRGIMEKKKIWGKTVEKLTKYASEINEFAKKTAATVEKVAGNPALQEAVKQANEMYKRVGTVALDMAQRAIDLTSGIVGVIQQCDFTPLIKGFQSVILPLQYISILRRIKWPLFFIEDESFRESIMDACSGEDDYNRARNIALSYCNDEFIENLRQEWKENTSVMEARFPVLSSAIDLHKQGEYYGSVSILMCQLYGICNDIVVLAKNKGLILTAEDKDFVAEHFCLDRKFLDRTEKGRLFQTVFFTESGMLLWEAMVEYLRDEILSSSPETMVVSDQPLRNKICHGGQLNFGTEEHSLKAILTIDMLMQLAMAIDGISMEEVEG